MKTFIPLIESKYNTKSHIELPDSSSTVATNLQQVVGDRPRVFKIMMTNLCNLSCTYCFQQHMKNTIPWTVEGLTLLLDGMIEAFPDEELRWDWFGGEPMIYKKVIEEFIDINKDKINNANISFEMSTNGTLLTEDFIKKFFEIERSYIALSLDTVMIEEDNRNLDKKLLAGILEKLNMMAKYGGIYKSCVTITLSREQIKNLKQTLWTIYRLGGRNIAINPLVYNNTVLVDWTEEEIDSAANMLVDFGNLHKDTFLEFGTEVVLKDSINCLNGDRLLSIDGSGDLSGCFFFSNDKEGFKDSTIGNIFTGEVNYNITKFVPQAESVLKNDPRCRTCNFNNLCTMCPVGVHRTTNGEGYFRSNTSCQAVVKNHIKVNDLMDAQNVPFRLQKIEDYNK